MKTVSVVISNYNYAKYLHSSIDSCLSQTYPCKIIVVDDVSTDSSWKILQEYGDKITRVRLKENSKGNARGKNIGICLSNTDYITCLDSDDMLLSDSIEQRIKFAEKDNFVHGWSNVVKSDEHFNSILPLCKNKEFHYDKRSKELKSQAPSRWTWAIHASTVLASRNLYEKFGLYDEEMRWSIDREMWFRWLSHGVKYIDTGTYVSIYRKHDSQVTKNRAVKDPERSRKLLVDRQTSRCIIDKDNTLLMDFYDSLKYISENNL